MKLNIKEDQLYRLYEHEKFRISDLKHLLSMFPEETEVRFSVLLKNGLLFTQEENIIFTVSFDAHDDNNKNESNAILRIVTNSKPYVPKI